jgi:heat shock protein HtpX
MLKRIVLFLLTNLAVVAVISILLSIFHVQPYLSRHGIDYQALMVYALIVGFSGAIISLLLAKWLAKRAYNIKIIDKAYTQTESMLLATVRRLANQMHVGMPEVGIYESAEPNAFATGWNKNKALVAVSSGLLNLMSQDELEGVLGHEMSHVANGDMVTLTLLQGVVNTFVIFFARIAAFAVSQLLRRDDDESPIGGVAYYLTAFIFEILFGILASLIVMWFSRYREYRADAGSAKYVGKEKMIKALQRLQLTMQLARDEQAPSLEIMKIAGGKSLLGLFSSHPPLEERIKVLQVK